MSIDTNSLHKLNVTCPEQLSRWLNLHTSLTEALYQITGHTELEVISQGWVNTDWWQKNLLKIQEEQVYLREILMKSKGSAYWYARSIIPKQCYDLDPAFFGRLENESIRNLIFADEKVQLAHRLNYPIDKGCLEYYWVKNHYRVGEETLWIRLAEFVFKQQKSFYLVEVMFPELARFEIPIL